MTRARGAAHPPKKRRICTLPIGRRCDGSQPSREHRTPPEGAGWRATDSIAPTEFPRAWSAAWEIGLLEPPIRAAYTPQVEETRGRSHPVTGSYRPWSAPESLGEVMARPTIHRRQMVPAAVRHQGFRSPPSAHAQPDGCHLGRGRGASMPWAVGWPAICVAGHHLGNRLS